ncbi:transcriptional repressor LexA [Thiolinea disciformis]|uniref:transcriptional repressor LexA n=1 Tax=Thiolinea disciformis TaxID=125614 RepID=UPI000365CD6D|nr:transcriptional repressor LexA [Thiolinea disciformis]
MLTRKQQQIWEVIQQWYNHFGYAPTLDEIGQKLGIKSRSTVHQHIQTLIQKNVLLSGQGKRAYQMPKPLLDQHPQLPLALTSLPLEGQIAAGQPIQAISDQADISPNELFLGPGRYALKVKGESMIDIGVMDGDYVVIQRTEEARNGEIVVALIEREEATLKRIYYQANGQIELHPENKTMRPMIYPAQSVQIQGRMIGLFRSYR